MKNVFAFAAAASLLAASNLNAAPTTMLAGDIAIVGMRGVDPDSFDFLLLKDVGSGTVITFTDSGILSGGAFRGGEGGVIWTAPIDYAAGSFITFWGLGAEYTNGNDANLGVNGLDISTEGDQLIAFVGSSASPTFIAAAQSNSRIWQAGATGPNDSALPPGLTNGVNAVASGAGTGPGDEFSNIWYIGTTTNGTGVDLRSAINNNDNWTGDEDNYWPTTSYTVTVPVPVELDSFVID